MFVFISLTTQEFSFLLLFIVRSVGRLLTKIFSQWWLREVPCFKKESRAVYISKQLNRKHQSCELISVQKYFISRRTKLKRRFYPWFRIFSFLNRHWLQSASAIKEQNEWQIHYVMFRISRHRFFLCIYSKGDSPPFVERAI